MWTKILVINVGVVAARNEVLSVSNMLLPLGTSSTSWDCGTSKLSIELIVQGRTVVCFSEKNSEKMREEIKNTVGNLSC